MAPLYKTATAICLVALSGIRSAAVASEVYKFEEVQVDDAAYLAANLTRNGKLPVHIEEVTKDEGLVSSLQEKVKKAQTPVVQEREVTKESCEKLMVASNLKDTTFHYTFEYKDPPNYSELLQEALKAGLEVFGNKYPSEWTSIWTADAGASLAYLLWSKSTKIGCVIGKCTKGAAPDDGVLGSKEGGAEGRVSTGEASAVPAVLFCQLDPAPTKNQAPFDEEYFTGLIARTARLEDMTTDDLKAPTNDDTAAAALPTIMFAGLAAMIAAVYA
ncbi:SAG family member [Eimeria brunetti]|uniref:SAG family member n=1 Tax=Eimeria brunetti TaxID=51314 RepID=U6L5D8_9EIME|nr:SAG family member [Eimeria brunetti]